MCNHWSLTILTRINQIRERKMFKIRAWDWNSLVKLKLPSSTGQKGLKNAFIGSCFCQLSHGVYFLLIWYYFCVCYCKILQMIDHSLVSDIYLHQRVAWLEKSISNTLYTLWITAEYLNGTKYSWINLHFSK